LEAAGSALVLSVADHFVYLPAGSPRRVERLRRLLRLARPREAPTTLEERVRELV